MRRLIYCVIGLIFLGFIINDLAAYWYSLRTGFSWSWWVPYLLPGVILVYLLCALVMFRVEMPRPVYVALGVLLVANVVFDAWSYTVGDLSGFKWPHWVPAVLCAAGVFLLASSAIMFIRWREGA